MPGPTLNARELGEEIGRSESWVLEHWAKQAAIGRLPKPINSGGALTWSRAQVYAIMDAGLTPKQREAAMAYRAAAAAAANAKHVAASELEDAAWREKLDARREARQKQNIGQ